MAKLSRAVLKQAVDQVLDEALTVYGVAREYDRHPNTVMREIALGHLPVFKIGRQTLVWRDDCDEWAARIPRPAGRPRTR
jgi:hypothetical protein